VHVILPKKAFAVQERRRLFAADQARGDSEVDLAHQPRFRECEVDFSAAFQEDAA